MKFDMSPRRVWLGLSVPGKKMMALLNPDAGIERGRQLIEIYQGTASLALINSALALHSLPKQPPTGPAFRDLGKPLRPVPAMLFGAILTDIRDFLKFRFRASGLPDTELPPLEDMLEDLASGRFPDVVEPARPHRVVNYVISALDALSRDEEGKADFVAACEKLRDLLRETGKLWRTGRGQIPSLDERLDAFDDSLFED